MKTANKHIIGTQKVEVEFKNPKDAFGCRTQLADACKYKLIPAMESVLDDYLVKDNLVSINRLTLDVGTISAENWETVFVDQVIGQLKDFLKKHISPKYDSKQEEQIEKLEENSFGDEQSITLEGLVVKKGLRDSDALLFYLKNGRLPWNTTTTEKEALKKGILKIAEKDSAFKQQIIAHLLSDGKVLKRWAYLLSEKESIQILKEKNWPLETLLKELKDWKKLLDRLSKPQQSLLFLKAFIRLVRAGDKKLDKPSHRLSQLMIKELQKEEPSTYQEIKDSSLFKELKQGMDSLKETETKTKEETSIKDEKQVDSFKKKPEGSTDEIDDHSIEGKETQTPQDSFIKEPRDQKNNKKESLKKENNNGEPEMEPVYIANSGLVLLHPFLSNLFKNLGYTENEEWISREKQERAVLLIQYLIVGEQATTEHDLFLNKILCGYPIHEPIPLEIELSEAEQQEANDLLNSVIQHWSALKNTSVEGLQTTFLQRAGKIEPITSGWLLQVEQKGMDILLDKIPWGFATVRTPWMKELISVEWA